MNNTAIRLKDGVTVLSNSGVIDNTPEFTGPINEKYCVFCWMRWKHSKLLHIDQLEREVDRLEQVIKYRENGWDGIDE